MKNTKKTSVKLSWKVADILGFEVYDQDGKVLGLLTDVITTGNNDVWTIKSDYQEVLIPALKSIVAKVDVAEKKIFVILPKGYIDIYGTKVKLDEAAIPESSQPFGYVIYED
jgi:16S rRNA processing protein RimM